MRLSVNIDHVATLRNSRGGRDPDPIEAAAAAEAAGADGIVCHLREDRRHIRDEDVIRLRKSVTTKMDLEMAATREIIAIARRIRPDLVTLVPERRRELTTEGGLDVVTLRTSLRTAICSLHDRGIAVSLFIDPVREQVEASREIGTDMIEIHTGAYADERRSDRRRRRLSTIRTIAAYARSLGLTVNAGHGLNYDNITPMVGIRDIEEVSIGHAIVVRAVAVGLGRAVQEMVRLVQRSA